MLFFTVMCFHSSNSLGMLFCLIFSAIIEFYIYIYFKLLYLLQWRFFMKFIFNFICRIVEIKKYSNWSIIFSRCKFNYQSQFFVQTQIPLFLFLSSHWMRSVWLGVGCMGRARIGDILKFSGLSWRIWKGRSVKIHDH